MRLRTCLLPASAVLPLFAARVLAQFQSDFTDYPIGAQSCLYSASDSSNCSGNTADAVNSCLCTNGGDFITNAAKCIGKNSPSDLDNTYTTLEDNCEFSNTPVSFSRSQFLDAAQVTTTTAASAKATATSAKSGSTRTTTITTEPTNTGSSNNNNNNNNQDSTGLSTAAKIGIGAGSAAAALAVIAALLFCCLRRRRNNSREESRPMLSQFPPSAYPDQSQYPPGEAAPAYNDPQKFSDAKPGWGPGPTQTGHSGLTPEPSPGPTNPGTWAPSPQQVWDPTHQAQSWGTPQSHQTWSVSPQTTGGYPPPPPHAQGEAWHQPPANIAQLPAEQTQAYELASMPQQAQAPAPQHNAVEMPAPVQAQAPQYNAAQMSAPMQTQAPHYNTAQMSAPVQTHAPHYNSAQMSVPVQALPPQHSAVEMPAAPVPYPGNNESYPGQWQQR